MAQVTLFIDTIFESGGFWPDVSARAWMEGWRIPSDAKDAMLAQCLLQSIIETNAALETVKSLVSKLGFNCFEDYIDENYPDDTINDIPELKTLYLSAVGNLAKAKTLIRLQSVRRKQTQETEINATESTEFYFLDEYQNSVSQIFNKSGLTGTPTTFGVYVSSL